MRALPAIDELLKMSRWAIKRLRLTPKELEALEPNARIIIANKTSPYARQPVIHKDGSGISLRVRGRRWEHHGWEIRRRDYRLLLPHEKKHIADRGVPIVEEYST